MNIFKHIWLSDWLPAAGILNDCDYITVLYFFKCSHTAAAALKPNFKDVFAMFDVIEINFIQNKSEVICLTRNGVYGQCTY